MKSVFKEYVKPSVPVPIQIAITSVTGIGEVYIKNYNNRV